MVYSFQIWEKKYGSLNLEKPTDSLQDTVFKVHQKKEYKMKWTK